MSHALTITTPEDWLSTVAALVETPQPDACSRNTRSHALYVFVGAGGRPLYIGLTVNVGQRFVSHFAYQPWRDEAIAYYWRPGICCRRHAQRAEVLAIKHYHPAHNTIRSAIAA